MSARDLVIGAALVTSGVATMTVIISPVVSLKGTSHVVGSLIAERWYEPAVTPKADQLKIAIAEPDLLDPVPIGPRDGDPIEQAGERKLFNGQVEAKEYKHEATEREELCSRHGMHRKYFRRHHHQVWRCVKRGQWPQGSP